MVGRSIPVVFVVVAVLTSACSGSAEPLTTPDRGGVDNSTVSTVTLPRLKDEPRIQLVKSTDPDEIVIPSVTAAPVAVDEGTDAPKPASEQQPRTPTVSTEDSIAGSTPEPTPMTEPVATPGPDSVASFPASMVVIRGGEDVLLVDTTSGTARLVANLSPKFDPGDEVGPQVPYSVDVDPTGAAVRYDRCCDEDESATLLVDLHSGEQLGSWPGSLPSVSHDGSTLALSRAAALDLVDMATSATTTISRSDGMWFIGRTSWSPNGLTLAVEVFAATFGSPVIALVDALAPSLDTAVLLDAPPGRSWTLPTFRADGKLVVLENSVDGVLAPPGIVVVDRSGVMVDTIGPVDLDAILDMDYDVSGRWLLVVDGRGDAFWFGPTGAGRLPGSGYSSASW